MGRGKPVSDAAWKQLSSGKDLLERERDQALARARLAHQRLRDAETAYEFAVMEAHSLGVPNTRLAGAFGLSETAVRTFIKRRQ